MKLILKQKTTLNSVFVNFLKVFSLLKIEDKSFKWSFLSFLWKVLVLKSHDLLITKEGQKIILILVIKKYRVANQIKIEHVYINTNYKQNAFLITALRVRLVQYSVHNYEICFLDLKTYDKRQQEFFEMYMNFEDKTEINLVNRFKAMDDWKTLVKYLKN